jgi:hypothetical protein
MEDTVSGSKTQAFESAVQELREAVSELAHAAGVPAPVTFTIESEAGQDKLRSQGTAAGK